jgi:putative zinc finger/helix-turn-helix YgiT family protein
MKDMHCVVCDNSKPFAAKLVHKYEFKECGLDSVVLINGVYKSKCPKCGEEYTAYIKVGAVHRAIFNALLKKDGVLTAKEIRFIRKHLGYGAEEFARFLRYSREAYSRIENGKDKITDRVSQAIRLAAFSKPDPDRNYDLHDAIKTDSLERFKKLIVDLTNGVPQLKCA